MARSIGRLARLTLVLGCGLLWGWAASAAYATPSGDLAELEKRFQGAEKELGAEGAYDKFREEFVALAQAEKGNEAGLGAELWLLRMHWWKRQEGTMQKDAALLARRLVTEYPKFAELKRIPEFSYLFSDTDFVEICEALSQKTPHAEVKAECLFSVAKKLKRSDPEKAKQHFIELKREFGELPYRYITYGQIAEANLNPHDKSKLKVGERAPEIIGVDVNGEPMKLSDYRGKVVVLDFWGDW